MGLAGLLVLFLLYLLAFTPLTANRDQQRLADALKGAPLTVYSLVNGRLPADGSAVAVIKIPAIGVDKVVVAGTSAADLMNGPGLMPGSSLPGSPGNSVIAARRVTFGGTFGSIGSLRTGDRIEVVDGAGSFVYKVNLVGVVPIGHKDVVLPTTDDRITLVTSNSSLVTWGAWWSPASWSATPSRYPTRRSPCPVTTSDSAATRPPAAWPSCGRS